MSQKIVGTRPGAGALFPPPPDVCAHAQAAARLRPRKAAAAAPPPDALLRSLRALLADATDVQDGAGLLPRAAESALTAPAGSVPVGAGWPPAGSRRLDDRRERAARRLSAAPPLGRGAARGDAGRRPILPEVPGHQTIFRNEERNLVARAVGERIS